MDEERIEENKGRNKKLDGILKSMGRGEILFTLRFDRYFPHIVYIFFLIFMVLLMNLMIEKTMVQVEENKKEIYDLKIALTHKNTELIGLEKLSSVQEMLEKSGSDLGIPDNPAIYIIR